MPVFFLFLPLPCQTQTHPDSLARQFRRGKTREKSIPVTAFQPPPQSDPLQQTTTFQFQPPQQSKQFSDNDVFFFLLVIIFPVDNFLRVHHSVAHPRREPAGKGQFWHLLTSWTHTPCWGLPGLTRGFLKKTTCSTLPRRTLDNRYDDEWRRNWLSGWWWKCLRVYASATETRRMSRPGGSE